MDNRKPPPQPKATAESKFKDGNHNEPPGNALGSGSAPIAAKREHQHSISIRHEIEPESTAAEHGKKEQEEVVNDMNYQGIHYEKKRPVEEEDMLQVHKATGDDSSLLLKGEEMVETESSTRPSLIDTLLSIRLLLEQLDKPDIPQEELQMEWDPRANKYICHWWDREIRTVEHQRDADLEAVVRGDLDWNEVNPTPDEYKGSELLFIRAIRHGVVKDVSNITFREPVSNVVADCLKLDKCPWENVPNDLKNDLEFCRSLLCPHRKLFSNVFRPFDLKCRPTFRDWCERAVKVLHLHPETLFSDRDVWQKIFDHSSSNDGYPAIALFCCDINQPIDSDIIREAVTKCPKVFEWIDQVLHESVVRELVIEDRAKLFLLDSEFLRQFPDVFVDQLGALEREDLDRVHDDVPENFLYEFPFSIWTDHPNLINTWIRVGLPRLDHAWTLFYESEWDDRDMLMWIAQNGARKNWRLVSFELMPGDIADDIDFIKSAMEFEPGILQYSSRCLQERDLRLWAMSDPYFVEYSAFGREDLRFRNHRPRLDMNFALPTQFVEDINAAVADLRMQQTFVSVFLVAVRHQCSLGLLGDPAYLKSIRDYAGIAYGNKLLRCRQALATAKSVLESWGVDMPDSWSM